MHSEDIGSLMLGFHEGERIYIGESIELHFKEMRTPGTHTGVACIGLWIKAPKSVSITRSDAKNMPEERKRYIAGRRNEKS